MKSIIEQNPSVECFNMNGSWSHFVVTKKFLDEMNYFDERFLLHGEEDGDFVYNVSMIIEMGEIYEEDVVSDQKQIVVLDSKNNPLDVLSTQEKDGKIYVRVKNQNNFDQTNNYFTTNDYGLDEYPLTDEWAKSVMKYKNKSKNNE